MSGEQRWLVEFGPIQVDLKAELYDEAYYERGADLGISGYRNYRWMEETIVLAHEVVIQLGIRKTERVLDYGCAKAFLVRALRMLRHDAWGYDISKYAVENAHPEAKPFVLDTLDGHSFDWVVSKDVLEHVPYAALTQLLQRLCTMTRKAFVVVPLGVAGKDGSRRYVIADYESDVTHVIREDLWWWCRQFEAAGFYIEKATTDMKHIKSNWEHHVGGNGFFVLRRDAGRILR